MVFVCWVTLLTTGANWTLSFVSVIPVFAVLSLATNHLHLFRHIVDCHHQVAAPRRPEVGENGKIFTSSISLEFSHPKMLESGLETLQWGLNIVLI